ncbi:transposase [Streptomyces sp. NBC_00878]|uniref:transposase n=1 Tax=Streptomyces sp. NBC_00878 TaxID=2975854 RepID=UPI002259E7A9|nr:transposase [Streptomyces sp. NBC_00878]MCX4905732.1 transposase [Streptomyces sp. NBC_00878]
MLRKNADFRSTWGKADAPPREVPMFTVVPRRWVIERSSARLARYLRLSRDYEYLTTSQENAIYLATVVILLQRTAKALP